ncbi:hypothetical protein MVEN_01147200 [Mycena venus]|uniref:Uncharacterized protein n=1 Tax=Mycena venus TaxID=2733690 RepID=A0A8H6Y4Q2_9AGAR|nr:hypothetical protein MVEN_01147200 [Mycena venus]
MRDTRDAPPKGASPRLEQAHKYRPGRLAGSCANVSDALACFYLGCCVSHRGTDASHPLGPGSNETESPLRLPSLCPSYRHVSRLPLVLRMASLCCTSSIPGPARASGETGSSLDVVVTASLDAITVDPGHHDQELRFKSIWSGARRYTTLGEHPNANEIGPASLLFAWHESRVSTPSESHPRIMHCRSSRTQAFSPAHPQPKLFPPPPVPCSGLSTPVLSSGRGEVLAVRYDYTSILRPYPQRWPPATDTTIFRNPNSKWRLQNIVSAASSPTKELSPGPAVSLTDRSRTRLEGRGMRWKWYHGEMWYG